MITRRFECTVGGSDKFWEVTYPESSNDGTSTWRCRWGRRGTDGQSKAFGCVGWPTARRDALDKVDEKLAKGYIEVGQIGEPIIRPLIHMKARRATHQGRVVDPAENRKPQPVQDFDQPKRRKIVLQ